MADVAILNAPAAADPLAGLSAQGIAILHALPLGLALLDTDGHCLMTNDAFAETVGGGCHRDSGGLAALAVEDDRERLRRAIGMVLTGSPEPQECRIRLAMRPDENVALTLAAAPAGWGFSVLVAVRDIREQLRLEQQVAQVTKMQAVGQLAGGIAHDFNNILTAILGNLSLAKMYCAPTDRLYPRLGEAERASLRAKDLTQQLLTFAKGGAPLKHTASLKELIKESASFALRGANVRCEFELALGLWTAEVDEGQMSQVIHNLVLNAVQAMPDGGVIRVTAENVTLATGDTLGLKPGPYLRISLADRGVGIAPENLPHIFDPYFTTKQKGSGLGLATSYSIIKKHDGMLTVESEVGRGTTFRIHLPASNKPMEKVAPPKVVAPRGKGRVLVMDDEALIRELAVAGLSQLGYQVETAPDGAEALRMYSEAKAAGQPFAAVIMDLTIPGGMGGKEAIKQLLLLDPAARVIVSSGYSNDAVMANFRHYGFKGVVAKPYKMEELAAAVNTLVQEGAA